MIALSQPRVGGGPDADPVVTIPWPAEDARRASIEATSRAALLIVEPGQPPPRDLGPLEDWTRLPLDPVELEIRASGLRTRHRLRRDGVHVDDVGVLHCGGQRVQLTQTQQALVVPLLAGIGQPVARREVEDAFHGAGGPTDPDHVRRALHRLRARVTEVGLDLHLLSGRAVLLEARTADPQFT
jgi:hypothetical protein